MGRAGKQPSRDGAKRDEVGDSQQRLSRSAGVLHLKRKTNEVKVPLAEQFDGGNEASGMDSGEECPLGILPRVIFSKKDMPGDGRINTNSRIDRLSEIVEVLDGTPELEWIKDSQFGQLFNLPTRYCEFSGRLVHGLICRSLITDKKREMWFVFGGKPLRFSLKEFAMITGLNCNPLPSQEERNRLQTPEENDEDYWNYLIGKQKTMSIEGIVRMLKADRKLPPHKRMDPERRLKLCLVVVVEGILCIKSSVVVATKETVEMVKDLESFCNYPWGRESFELTMRMVSVGEKVRSVEDLAGKLYQSHFSNHGFTLAFQLLAIYTIPLLEKIIPVKDFDSYFYDPLFTGLAKSKPFHNTNILAAEENPDLIVESLLSTGHSTDDWDLSWEDEVNDPRVDTIINGLETGYTFKPKDWKSQQIRPTHRNPKARARKIEGGKMFAGVPRSDSGNFTADSLVLEGDRLMDDYLTRKHDFEIKEMEALREGYRNLLIKALTINQHNTEGAAGGSVDEDAIPVYTPARRVRGASDAESLTSGETDSPPQLRRKNIGKGRKGKAKGKRVQADVGEERGDSDQENKRKKMKETTESPSGIKETDQVGASISHIVQDIDKMCSEGVEPVNLTVPDSGVAVEASKASTEVPPTQLHGQGLGHTTATVGEDVVMASADPKETVPEQEKMDTPLCGQESEEAVIPPKKASQEHAVGTETTGVEKVGETTKSDDRTDSQDLVMDTEPTLDQHDGEQKTNTEYEQSVTEAIDSHGDEKDSLVGATDENIVKGRNYCSGDEDDDAVAETAETENEVAPAGDGEQRPIIALRSTRARKEPKRYGQTPEQKQETTDTMAEEDYDPLRPVAESKRQLLLKALDGRKIKEVKVLGEEVKKSFFRELYKPKQHLTTAHMEALLSSVWARRGGEMLSSKVGVMDMWFCQYLLQEHGRYCKTKNPPIPFKWHPAIVNYVNGTIDNREGRLRWMVDVDQVYAPMNWGGNHWVALNINLVSGSVNILDCNQNLTPETKVPRVMKPIIEVLPLILRDLVDPALGAADSFDCTRCIGVTQNERAGDCGALTVKFIELDAQGHSVDGISDEGVDQLRMRYAVEVYEDNGNSF